MTYNNAVKYIKNAPNITPRESYSPEMMLKLLALLGNPQKKLRYVRFTGNNGKTVCLRMVSSILSCAGITSGCFSMPIHSDIRNNIRVGGVPIGMEETAGYVSMIRRAVDTLNFTDDGSSAHPFYPTAHEILLCIAMLAFSEQKCDICLIESGSRSEDPSRFLPAPFAAVICGHIPSDDMAEILKIRSHICRGITEIVSAPQDNAAFQVISETCSRANARLTMPVRNRFSIKKMSLGGTDFVYKDVNYSIRLCGKFQTVNALTAIETVEMLIRNGYSLSRDSIVHGLFQMTAPCKFEVISISPAIIADSTHTQTAIEAVCSSLCDFKEITGTRLRLCLPPGDIIDDYAEVLTKNGYTIENIIVLEEDGTAQNIGHDSLPVTTVPTVKSAVKHALRELNSDIALLISGPSNFTLKVRYELLSVLGLNG